jgi:hypothetical protein
VIRGGPSAITEGIGCNARNFRQFRRKFVVSASQQKKEFFNRKLLSPADLRQVLSPLLRKKIGTDHINIDKVAACDWRISAWILRI